MIVIKNSFTIYCLAEISEKIEETAGLVEEVAETTDLKDEGKNVCVIVHVESCFQT